MSRSISIGYGDASDGPNTSVEVRPPYFLLGGQRTSMQFWSIARLKDIGITRLTELGVSDPVVFSGWDDMADLYHEVSLLQQHLESIQFDPEIKAQWVSHLVYCYFLLVQSAPKTSTPYLSIG